MSVFDHSGYEHNPLIDENWEKLARSANKLIEASEVVIESGLFVGEAAKKAQRADAEFLSNMTEKSVEATKKLAVCGSLPEVVNVQTDFIGSMVEMGFNHAARLFDLFNETNLKYVEAVDKNRIYINSRVKQACGMCEN